MNHCKIQTHNLLFLYEITDFIIESNNLLKTIIIEQYILFLELFILLKYQKSDRVAIFFSLKSTYVHWLSYILWKT